MLIKTLVIQLFMQKRITFLTYFCEQSTRKHTYGQFYVINSTFYETTINSLLDEPKFIRFD